MPTLAVIGAGPKGIAIAAKARALAAVGLDAPEVVLVDRSAVAGNWSGRQGYTSGLLPLGTPPEKDVGFPYADSWGTSSYAVTAAMAEFSWQRHLISCGAYSDWVDRGRMRPTHRQWSAYLREVAERAEAEIVSGEVVGLEVESDEWRVTVEPGEAISADGVVLTGSGPPIAVSGQPQGHPRVLDGRSYWLHEHAAKKELAGPHLHPPAGPRHTHAGRHRQPGWAPVYLSNLTEDIPGYVEAPAHALAFPWKHYIGGHLGRLGTRDDVTLHQQYMADIDASVRTALNTVDPTPYFVKYGENAWAGVKGYLDALADTAAAPVIEKYTGVLAAADVFTPSTAFWVMESIRLDLGYASQVHP